MDSSTGYAGRPLVKKLGIKSGMTVFFSQPPAHYLELLGPLPEELHFLELDEPADFIHHFETSESNLKRDFPELKDLIKKTGTLWISWPKKASKMTSDLSDGIVRKIGLEGGLVDTKVCAVDKDWSALKFMYRTKDR